MHSFRREISETRGQTLVEFSLVTVMLVMLMLGVFEMCRVVMVYTTVANAARVGARYAMVHGADSSVSPQVQTVVNNYLSAGTVNTSKATVTTSYPDPTGSLTSGCTSVGCTVTVSISYPYDVMSHYFPLHLTLASTSAAAITY